MPLELHKILVDGSDWFRMLRAFYAEDMDLLTTFHQNAGEGLDACVATTLANISDGSSFYKVEMPDGTLVGYFVVATGLKDADVMEGFFIRPDWRTTEVKTAFVNLLNETFANDFYTSTGANNYRAIKFLLKYNFNIINPDYVENNKSFVILKATNPQK